MSQASLTERQPARIPGVKSGPAYVGLGWLRFTCDWDEWGTVANMLKEFFKCEITDRKKGWNGYLVSWTGAYSIIVAGTPRLTQQQREDLGVKKSPNEGFLTCDLTQTALDALPSESLLPLTLTLLSIPSLRLSRADVYLDDYAKTVSPSEMKREVLARRVGIPRMREMRSWSGYNLASGKSAGETVYLGSTKSQKQIRYYDKESESNGKQKCYRLEVQLMNEKANAFWNYFVDRFGDVLDGKNANESAKTIAQILRETIKGSVDFLDISKAEDPWNLPSNWASRFPRVYWFERLVAQVDKALLRITKVPPSLSAIVSWVKSQVTPALALIKTVYRQWGIPWNAWLTKELDEAEERWSDRHFNLFKDAILTSPAV